MPKGSILLFGIVFLIGCVFLFWAHAIKATTPTPEEQAIVKKYDALPGSAKAALMAKNLVGLTIFQKTPDHPLCSQVFEVFMRNGARRASSEKTADLIIFGKPTTDDHTDITVKDKFGNYFFNRLWGSESASNFALEIADTLGTETKVDVIQKQHRQSVIDSHKRVLGL